MTESSQIDQLEDEFLDRPTYHTIVVGTDGSPLAVPAVARAAHLAAEQEAELVIVCAYTPLSGRAEAINTTTTGADPRIGRVQGKRAALDAIESAMGFAYMFDADIRASLIVDADPAEALLSAADDYAADLIVMGARRDVSLAERLMGVVSTAVTRRAHCDVLVVRPTRLMPTGDEWVDS